MFCCHHYLLAYGNAQASCIGEFFRNLEMRKGYQCAVTATACKLAVIIYKMLTSAEQFREVKAGV